MNNFITSSTENRIVGKICCDICGKEKSIHCLTTIVKYDEKKKKICFVSLKEWWKSGLFIKKYVEYPYSSSSQLDGGFDEMNYYLEKGGYIVHFLDENIVSEDIVYVVDILMHRNEIRFVSKSLSGNIEEELIPFEEYCKRFLSSGKQNSKKYDN